MGLALSLVGMRLVASLLFGVLFQGGAELDFEFTTITREMVLLIQGLIILFCGALALMLNPLLGRVFALAGGRRDG